MSVYSLKERELMDSLNTLFREAVKAIVSALEAKDPYTYGHSLRVSEYALLMGEALKLGKEDLVTLELGALLHDIGKIGTPDHILLKAGHLTKEEFEIMKKHPVQSAEILSHIELLKDVVPIVKYHQERMDGLGYPDGLKGEQIPLLCRIVYIADAFDAMTSDRPYRKALPLQQAYDELVRCSGEQFDPKLVPLFIQAHQSKKSLQHESPIFPRKQKRKIAA